MLVHAPTATVLSRETIGEVRSRVFRQRESTMMIEAARFTMADYEATLTSIRRVIRTVLDSLPDAAFSAQHDNGDRWSVGQVIAHVHDAQINIFLAPARAIAGLPSSASRLRPDNPQDYPALNRSAAFAILDDADRDLLEVVGLIGLADEVSGAYEDERKGRVQLKDLFMFLTIHDDDHLAQLEELASAHA